MIILDGKRMCGRKEIFAYLKEALPLPEYCGANLDALSDGLGDMKGLEKMSIVNSDVFLEACGAYGHRLLQVFSDHDIEVLMIDAIPESGYNIDNGHMKEAKVMSNIPTPHINAPEGAFARTVLMPGDPLRAKYIAEHYFEDAVLVNNVRGVQGYTGNYRGKRVSVMASGMGMPAIGIYSYELFNFYGVENIIRVGSAGAMTDKLKLRDIVVGMSAYTNSNYGSQFGFNGTLAPCCSYELMKNAIDAGERIGQKIVPGPIYSSDIFYDQGDNSASKALTKLGALCVEMEAYALYLNAAAAGKNALALLTISDSLVTGESLPAEDRQNTFTKMMEIALEIA